MDLSKFLEVSREKLDACMDSIGHSLTVTGIETNMRFHHLKFDGNKRPKVKELADCLIDHLVSYCMPLRRRNNAQRIDEYTRLTIEARKLLRKMAKSGESGEMLLYMLIEAVLHAPQMVAKMDLKTNPRLEVHGSDGIHMKWDPQDRVLDIYFGEAKLEIKASAALRHAFESIQNFHAEQMQEHEFGIVTSHYKWANDELRQAVVDYIDRGCAVGDARINHACLIGFDYDAYGSNQQMQLRAMIQDFADSYRAYAPKLRDLLQKQIQQCTVQHVRFEVFFLPFPNVQTFRDAFNNALE